MVSEIQNKCEICDKEFKSRNGVHAHFYSIHDEQKGNKCNICEKTFLLRGQLFLHMKIEGIRIA